MLDMLLEHMFGLIIIIYKLLHISHHLSFYPKNLSSCTSYIYLYTCLNLSHTLVFLCFLLGPEFQLIKFVIYLPIYFPLVS